MKKEDRLNREEIISFLGMLAKFNTVIAILFSITLIVYFNTSDYQILGSLFFFIYILVKLIENFFKNRLHIIQNEMISSLDEEFEDSKIAKNFLKKANEDFDQKITPEKKQALGNLEEFEKTVDPDNYENKKLTAEKEADLVALCTIKCIKGETLEEVIKKYGEENVINACYNQLTYNTKFIADSYRMAKFFSEVEKDDIDNEKLYKKRTFEIVYEDLGKAFQMFVPVLSFIEDNEIRKIAKDSFKIILETENLSYEDVKKEYLENPVSLLMDSEKLKNHIKNNKKWTQIKS